MAQHIGNVAIILNAHFPYVRRAGRWPHGEESLHKVIAESYVPLLNLLHDLRGAGQAVPLTLAISPVLLEQLADPVIAKHFVVWLADWRSRAVADLARFEAEQAGHPAYLARFYIDWIDAIEHSFVARFGRNLVGALRSLLRPSSEILLSPATYAYLPALSAPEVAAQLDVAALTVLQQLGRRPIGLWLPGGGYSPHLPRIANELGLRYAVGHPASYAGVERAADNLPLVHPDDALAQHVIGPGIGYPGDGLYREFYRDHPDSGIAYWRVTGADVSNEAKAWYDPYLAFSRVEEHAAHFVRAIRERLRTIPAESQPPTVVVAFDADLFGHWWFEGVHWLQRVLHDLLNADDLRIVPLRDSYAALPTVDARISMAATFNPFADPLTIPLHERLRSAALHFSDVVQRHPTAEGLEEAGLRQAARELLLAQSGDWPVLIATGAAREYAQRRFDEHLSRFERLLHDLQRDEPTPDTETYLHEIAELDNPFAFINYRMFA